MGRDAWQISKAGKTECDFAVDERDAADGLHSALLTVDAVEDWGMQFGQAFAAGAKGKTYTFAVFAKSTRGPVEVGLQIERTARPWDRAAGAKFRLTSEWQELHVSFAVEKDFREGWFAYISCAQEKAQFRADMFRLYEGAYVPYEQMAAPQAAAVAVRLYDANVASATPLTPEALSRRAGWAEVTEDNAAPTLKGDAVLANDRIAMVLRRGAPGAEVYSLGPGAPAMRAVLAPVAGSPVPALRSFTIVEHTASAGVADAVFAAGDGKPLTLRYELKVGQPFVQTESRSGVTGLRVEAPCRFAVLPDFFADDIVVEAADLPGAEADLPSDNVLLHLLPDHQALVMIVVNSSEEDMRIALSGQGKERLIDHSELYFGKEGKAWVGIMTGPGIWHEQEIALEQAGTLIPLDWKPPFPAQWRVDWRREENLTDSWEMINERPDGRFTKHSVYGGPDTIPADRKRWTTVLGWFEYPAWIDRDGRGCLQPLKTPVLRFQGPAIIYPLNRVSATALDAFTVLDVVRNTLGVGPCEYILDVEGQQSQYKGQATCGVRDTLNPIYASKQQKQRRAEVEKALVDVVIFIRHIRGRIESYVDFGHDVLAYLAEQRQAHPELAEPLAKMEKLARVIDAKVAARKQEIKTPEQAEEMVEEFRKTVLDDEGEDAPTKCKQFTEGWVRIGGNQDELAGECRWAVKMVRQQAGLMLAVDPRLAAMAKEIRRRSQIVLRHPANHEGARH